MALHYNSVSIGTTTCDFWFVVLLSCVVVCMFTSVLCSHKRKVLWKIFIDFTFSEYDFAIYIYLWLKELYQSHFSVILSSTTEVHNIFCCIWSAKGSMEELEIIFQYFAWNTINVCNQFIVSYVVYFKDKH